MSINPPVVSRKLRSTTLSFRHEPTEYLRPISPPVPCFLLLASCFLRRLRDVFEWTSETVTHQHRPAGYHQHMQRDSCMMHPLRSWQVSVPRGSCTGRACSNFYASWDFGSVPGNPCTSSRCHWSPWSMASTWHLFRDGMMVTLTRKTI